MGVPEGRLNIDFSVVPDGTCESFPETHRLIGGLFSSVPDGTEKQSLG